MGSETFEGLELASEVVSGDEVSEIRTFWGWQFDNCLYALPPTIPHLTWSSLHRCLQRHSIGRLPDVEGDRSETAFFTKTLNEISIGMTVPRPRTLAPRRCRAVG